MPDIKNRKTYIQYLKNPLTIFLIKGFLFYLIWDLLVYNYLITTAMHQWVIQRLLIFTSFFLNLFNPTQVVGDGLYIFGKLRVHVGIPCNGVEMMGVFACIVIAFRARWYHKLWMIVSGSIIIFILNSIRVGLLAALIVHHHLAFDINHKYIFNIFLYGTLLIIFSLWSSRFGILTDKHREI
jgi:exosortase/archaeosortase family protein